LADVMPVNGSTVCSFDPAANFSTLVSAPLVLWVT
jgi:hypothetical protein